MHNIFVYIDICAACSLYSEIKMLMLMSMLKDFPSAIDKRMI